MTDEEAKRDVDVMQTAAIFGPMADLMVTQDRRDRMGVGGGLVRAGIEQLLKAAPLSVVCAWLIWQSESLQNEAKIPKKERLNG